MRVLVCIDGRDWEGVIRGAAQYLSEGEAILAHVVDERAPRGYELSLRRLLGRKSRGSEERMASISLTAAERLLADAGDLLKRLCPGLTVSTAALSGPPNEELMRAAEDTDAIFIGRGAPGYRSRTTISGVMRGWKQNHRGETHGLSLNEGVEARFPPHKAKEVRSVAREGAPVEVSGSWRGRRLHAYSIRNPNSEASLEAHKRPEEEPGKRPLGHTARFVADHALCDVVVLQP